MRILLANKFFYPRAGAETVFFQSRDLLRGHGHEIVDFAMADPKNLPSADSEFFAPSRLFNEGEGASRAERLRNAGTTVYSRSARQSIRKLIQARRPDVAHLHNIYHQLTTSIIDELHAQGVPTVLTLHDYKVVCPSYDLYTEHAPCRRCVGHLPWHAVRHRCLKGSAAGSGLAAVEALLTRARRSYAQLDAVISPSSFLADLASQYIPPDRITVVPNFLNEPPVSRVQPVTSGRPFVLFAGRLEEVKGLQVLDAASTHWDARVDLRVAGAGPLESIARAMAADGRATFLGMLAREDVGTCMREALAVVVPSVWEENYPMSVIEARAAGTIPICSNRGGLRDMIKHGIDGLLFDPERPDELAAAVRSLIDQPELRERLRAASLQRVAAENSSEEHYDALMRIYAAIRRDSRPLAAMASR